MDTMDFMKRAWSHFKVPTSFTPTMDVEELDKRIADLRTVEQWLTMNLGLLRNTIQAMELQRATLSALQTMAANFEDALRTPPSPPDEDEAPATDSGRFRASADEGQDDASAQPSSEAGTSGLPAMPGFPGSPFSFVGTFPFVTTRSATDDSSTSDSDEASAAEPEDSAPDSPPEAPAAVRPSFWNPIGSVQSPTATEQPPDAGPAEQRPESPQAAHAGSHPAEPQAETAANAAPQTAATATTAGEAPDPLGWWRLLQSSFQQIATAAAASQAAAVEAAARVQAGQNDAATETQTGSAASSRTSRAGSRRESGKASSKTASKAGAGKSAAARATAGTATASPSTAGKRAAKKTASKKAAAKKAAARRDSSRGASEPARDDSATPSAGSARATRRGR